MVLPELGLLPFLNATLLEGHQCGVGKLRSVAFQRRIDDLLEVSRSQMAVMGAQVGRGPPIKVWARRGRAPWMGVGWRVRAEDGSRGCVGVVAGTGVG